MDQRLSLITLGVANLTKARKFYVDGLGWKASAASDDAIVFIQMGGIGLSLFCSLLPTTGDGTKERDLVRPFVLANASSPAPSA